MKKITEITEIQNLAYNLLKQFADPCDKRQLCYVLAGGTLLGAGPTRPEFKPNLDMSKFSGNQK